MQLQARSCALLARRAAVVPPAVLSHRRPHRPAALNSSSTPAVHPDIERILYDEQVIKQRVAELGWKLAQEYKDKKPVVIGVLKGAFMFTADLVRAMEPCPAGLQVNFVRASSYGSGTESSGEVKLKLDIRQDLVQGQHVLLVEDIVDTGTTIAALTAHLLGLGAASVRVAALLNKVERRKVDYQPDYQGFLCPNEFVVGYGLDFDEEYRSLPYIGVLRPQCYLHKIGK